MVSDAILNKFFLYMKFNNIIPLNKDGEEVVNASDLNIEDYDKEFKTFLIQEGANPDIMLKSIFEILSINENTLEGNKNSDELQYSTEQAPESSNNNIENFDMGENSLPMESTDGNSTNNTYSLDYITNMYSDFSQKEMNILNSLFDTDKDGVLSEDEYNQSQSFLGVLDGDSKFDVTDLNTLKEYFNTLDLQGLSEEEIITNLMGLDGDASNLTSQDFMAVKSSILSPEIIESLEEATAEGIQSNEVMESSDAGGSSRKTPAAKAMTEKNVQNMSLEDLEDEYEKAQGDKDSAFDKLVDETEKVDKTLSDEITKLTDGITDKQGELDNANQNLNEQNNILTETNASIDTANARVGEIDGEIADLQSQLDSANNPENGEDAPKVDTAAIESQIQALKEEQDKLKNETIPDLEEKRDATQEQIDILEQDTIPALEKSIVDLTQQLSDKEAELTTLSESHPELKEYLDTYNQSKDYEAQVKQVLDRRKADQAKAEESDIPDSSKGPKDYRDKDVYDFKNLPMTYTLDGKEYHCTGFEGYDLDGDGKTDFKPDSWEEMQRYFANAGIANIGQYGAKQCHNYSNVMVDVVMGTANRDLVKAMVDENEDPNFGDKDLAGKYGTQREYNSRDCLQCKAANRDQERAIIENELQNGRPCLVSVPYTGGQHWVVAVGMSDDGDILIWDSYNGSMEKLGCSSNSDTNKLHRNMATGNGVMVLVEGSSYQYATHGWINYWEDCVGQDPSYTKEKDASRGKKK